MRQSLYILYAIITVSLSAAEVTLNVSSANSNVPVNGYAHLTVTAQWPQGEKTYIVFKPDMPQLSGLKVVDHVCYHESVRNPSQGIQRIVHHFKLLVTNTPGTQAETGSIFVEYRNFKENNKQQRQLAGLMFKVESSRNPVLKGTLIAMGSATLLGACALLFGIRRSSRKGGSPVPGGATLEDHFLKELKAVRRSLIDGDITQYFHDVESLMRHYFRAKYQIGSIEDWEAPASGPAGPDERTTGVARELLKLSHSVRYAGYIPSTHEKNRIHSFLKTLLIKNQPRPPKPEEELYLKEETHV
jgi:hypothetical protein